MALRSFSTALLAVAALAASSAATAATMTYETRLMTVFTNPGVDGYRGWWGAQGGAIDSNPISDFNGTVVPGAGLVDSYGEVAGDDVFSHLYVAFTIPAGQTWTFQIAPDAGHGASFYSNGGAVASDTDASDQWWGGLWVLAGNVPNSTEYVSDSLTAGAAFFDVYWAEDCCNGPQGGRFSTDGGITWKELTVANLDAAAVPVPAAIWLLGSAFAGLIGIGRRRTA